MLALSTTFLEIEFYAARICEKMDLLLGDMRIVENIELFITLTSVLYSLNISVSSNDRITTLACVMFLSCGTRKALTTAYNPWNCRTYTLSAGAFILSMMGWIIPINFSM